jgi:hypothetical protein
MAKPGRPTSTFPAVPTSFPAARTADIGGVSFRRDTLTVQAEQLASLTGRIGRRLNHWLRTHRDGVPSAEFFEAFRYYQAALLGLLREQRERARPDCRPMSDEDFERGMLELRAKFLRAAHTFTPDEWALLDRARAEQSEQEREADDGERFPD